MSAASIFGKKRKSIFQRTIDTKTFDLTWILKDEITKKLNKLNQIQSLVKKHFIEITLPRITFLGKESAGKSTIINRIIGVCISNTAMGTCTIVPIEFKLKPADEFKIIYKKTPYNKSNIHEFQKAFEICGDRMKKVPAAKETQVVEVEGPGLPYCTLVDLPGSKGKDSEEYNTTIEHLKNGGVHDLIVLVHALHAPNGLDEIAMAVKDNLTLGRKHDGSKMSVIKNLVENHRIICVATCMDKTFGEVKDFDQKTFSQIENCEKRIHLGNATERDTIWDHLPGVKSLLTISPEDSSLGVEQNAKEKEFFDKTVEVYNSASEIFAEDGEPADIEKFNKAKEKWASHIKNYSGLEAVRRILINHYILNIEAQKEKIFTELAEIGIANYRYLRNNYHWYHIARSLGLNDDDKAATDAIIKEMLEYVHSYLNNELRKTILENTNFMKFPECSDIEQGKKELQDRKDKCHTIVHDIIENCKILAPYTSFKNKILNDATNQVDYIMDSGVASIEKIFENKEFYKQVVEGSDPMANMRQILHMEFVNNLLSLLSTNILDNVKHMDELHPDYYHLKPIQDFEDHFNKYIIILECMKEIHTLFGMTCDKFQDIYDSTLLKKPVYPEIEKQWENSEAVKDYLVRERCFDQVNSTDHPTMTSTSLIKKVRVFEEKIDCDFREFDINHFCQKINNLETILDKTKFQDYDIKKLVDSITNIEHKLGAKITDFQFTEAMASKIGKEVRKQVPDASVRRASGAFLSGLGSSRSK